MSPKKTVLFAIESLTVGGAERVLVNLANQFDHNRWQVHVVCLSEAGALASDLCEEVTLHTLHKKPGLDTRLFCQIHQLIRQISPDVINAHLWTANTWLRAANFKNIPIFITEHSSDHWKPRHYRWIDKILRYKTTRLIAVSQNVADYYRQKVGVSPKIIEVILNGIDISAYEKGDSHKLRQELQLPSTTPLIGMVGRMVSAKNYPRLVEAIRQVKAIIPDVKCVIAGDGPERPLIEKCIQEHQLNDTIFLLGTRTDVKDILAGLDLFTISSDREGHPLTALEAQVAGIPVVLTDVGGCKDAIVLNSDSNDIHGGQIVPPSAEALANAYIHLLKNEPLRKKMSEVSLQQASSQFSLERMIKDYDTLFLRAIKNEK